jgi:hypothetical protein
MSRTYRRLHAPDLRASALRESVLVTPPLGSYYFHYVNLDPRSPEGKTALARFHADNRHGGGPNKAYRQVFNRSDRRTAKHGLLRWWQRNDHDELLRDRHRHSATYAWW